MNFKALYQLFICCLFVLLAACSDERNETNLVNLHTIAEQDIIEISFPVNDTESVISINSEFDFSLLGLKSNGLDQVAITKNIQWSLSDNALSTIDQQGHFTAAATAELVTVNAQFGPLVESIDIKVSDARFDQVVALNKQIFSIDMCQSQIINPVARYVDDIGNEEIRAVDSIVINTIEWIVRNQEDDLASQRAHIETTNNQAIVRTLSAGNIIIQARAPSILSNTVVTSADFNQTVDAGLKTIKLCRGTDVDLISCGVTTVTVEQNKSISLVSVGTYQAVDGSDFNEEITSNSKWGIDNSNASLAFSSDLKQLVVTGETGATSANVSVACGDIVEAIDTIDIAKGVVLTTPVTCSSGIDCLTTAAKIDISLLGVTALRVKANDIDLNNANDDLNESTTLSGSPNEISLVVTADFSDNTSSIITDDIKLVYNIFKGEGTVIEEKTDSSGVFTVLGVGTAEIKLDYLQESFLVRIIVTL